MFERWIRPWFYMRIPGGLATRPVLLLLTMHTRLPLSALDRVVGRSIGRNAITVSRPKAKGLLPPGQRIE